MILCSFKPSKVIHFCDLQTWMHKAESMRCKTAPLFVRPKKCAQDSLWGKKIRTPSPRHVSQLQSILEIPAITVQGFLKIQDFQVILKRTLLPYLHESYRKICHLCNESSATKFFKAYHLGTLRWNVHGAGALEAGTYLLSESVRVVGDTTWAPSSYKWGYNPYKRGYKL